MKKRLNWEYSFFLLATLLNLLPVLAFEFFPTIDGPAHLYNAHRSRELLFGDNPVLQNNFVLNSEPVPNWTGHFFLSLAGAFLPAFMAEKVLLLLYMTGLPMAFRKLLITISPNNSLWSFIIFPFCYSFIFFLGFYNFLIGLVLMLWFTGFWVQRHFRFDTKDSMIAFLGLLALYFSHIFLFGFTLLVCALLTLKIFTHKQENVIRVLQEPFKRTSFLALLALPGLVLSLYFFFSREGFNHSYLSNYELVQWLKQLRPLIALSYDAESPYVGKIAYLLIFAAGVAAFLGVDAFFKSGGLKNIRDFFRQNIEKDIWLLIALLVLVLYFLLPDSNGYSGFISVRFGLLFFIILLVWIAVQDLPKWFALLAIAITVACSFYLNRFYFTQVREFNKVAVEVFQSGQYLSKGDAVLPLDYSNNWLQGHYSNYLGAEKPVVILENYEATMDYFPVKWNDASLPDYFLGEMDQAESCYYWRSNPNNESRKIDHVFILGKPDLEKNECAARLYEEINRSYKLVFEGDYSRLYELK